MAHYGAHKICVEKYRHSRQLSTLLYIYTHICKNKTTSKYNKQKQMLIDQMHITQHQHNMLLINSFMVHSSHEAVTLLIPDSSSIFFAIFVIMYPKLGLSLI